jgi:steroid delta-isomerase-like uncharacterized protein
MSAVTAKPRLNAPTALADAYLEAWQRHAVDEIVAMHTRDSVFTSVATGRRAAGHKQIAETLAEIFTVWPDLGFELKRRYLTPELIVTESTARATQAIPLPIGGQVIEPTGRPVEFAIADIFPLEGGLIKRKDSYLDAAGYIRQMKEGR